MTQRIIDNLIAWAFFLVFTTAGQKLGPIVLNQIDKMGPPQVISLTKLNRGLMGEGMSKNQSAVKHSKSR